MRKILMMCAVAGTTMTGQAGAQTTLVGFTGAGEMIEIDSKTGQGTLIVDLGMRIAGAMNTGARSVWALRDDGAIIGADPATGDWNVVMEPAGLPAGYAPVALDLMEVWEYPSRSTYLYVLVRPPSGDDELYRVATSGGEYEFVGACGVRGLVGLSNQFAMTSDGRLFELDVLTGDVYLIMSYPDLEPVGCVADFWWYRPHVAGESVWSLDLYYPIATPIGATRFDSLTGLAGMPPETLCIRSYVDCDSSLHYWGPDIFDFLCWQDRFVNKDPYACDCDMSTGIGVCDIFDFLCYQNLFVGLSSGC